MERGRAAGAVNVGVEVAGGVPGVAGEALDVGEDSAEASEWLASGSAAESKAVRPRN